MQHNDFVARFSAVVHQLDYMNADRVSALEKAKNHGLFPEHSPVAHAIVMQLLAASDKRNRKLDYAETAWILYSTHHTSHSRWPRLVALLRAI